MAKDELKDQAEVLRKRSEVPPARWLEDQRRSRRAQFRLLVFIVVAGLPTVAVPTLRHRLRSRIEILREVASAGSFVPQPVTLGVGENPEPFPSEFEKPFEPLPEWSNTAGLSLPTFRAQPGGEQSAVPSGDAGAQRDQPEAGQGADQGPVFTQGKLEREAYDLLLQSSSALAALVKGGDQSLRFQSWAAAKTEDSNSWLVRVTFLHQPDGSEREYIWQVKLLSKEIMPLSAYARALSVSKS
jgi:hypothetical protein